MKGGVKSNLHPENSSADARLELRKQPVEWMVMMTMMMIMTTIADLRF
jgi:hypothetical protein